MIIRSLSFSFIVVAIAMTGPIAAYFQSTAQGVESFFNVSRLDIAEAQVAEGESNGEEFTIQLAGPDSEPGVATQHVIPDEIPTTRSPFGDRSNDGGAFYTPPAIFVLGGDVPEEIGGTVSGTFTLANRNSDAVGDIRYRIDLIGAAPEANPDEPVVEDIALLYDRKIADDVFTLLPDEEREVSFAYTLPSIPSDLYRIRIQVITSQDRELGWYDFPVNYTATSEPAAYTRLIAGTINHPEFPDEIIDPVSGPNVDPAGSLQLRATIENPSAEAVTVTPTLETVRFGESDDLTTVTGPSVTIPADGATEIDFPITVDSTPGVFRSFLTANVAGSQASNVAEYRWIVRGNDAAIVSARINTAGTKAEEQVEVMVDFTGPGDAESSFTGQLEVRVEDDNGTAGTVNVSDITLDDALESGLARVTLTRDLVGAARVAIDLKNENGAVLDSYTVIFDLTHEQLAGLSGAPALTTSSNRTLAIALGSILVVALGILVLTLVLRSRRGHTPPAAPASIALFIALVLGGSLIAGAYMASAQAPGNGNGITVLKPRVPCSVHRDWCSLSRYVVEVFINRPIHNNKTAYNPNAVPLEYKVRWAVCANRMSFSRTMAKFLADGSTHNRWWPPDHEPWTIISDQIRATQFCGAYRCFASSTYSAPGGIRLSGLKEDSNRTTMQIQSLWAWHGIVPPWQELPWYYELYRPGSTLYNGGYAGNVHAVNLRLKLEKTSGPNGPRECNDGKDNDNDGTIDYSGLSCPSGNIVRNHSFETPFIGPNPGFINPPSLTGWKLTSSFTEIQHHIGLYGTPAPAGRQNAELDFVGQGIYQEFDNLPPGSTWNLTYMYAERPGYGAQQMDVLWNGELIHNSGGSSNPATPNWRKITKTVTASETRKVNRLTFRSKATGVRGGGNLLDQVFLTKKSCTPVPRDPDCSSPNDNTEEGNRPPGNGKPQCSDGKDNDNDGRKDIADSMCHTDGNPNNPNSYDPDDNRESGPNRQCADNRNNDAAQDSFIDGGDPECHTDGNRNNPDSWNPWDDRERAAQCADGRDNDNDGRIDAADPACHSDYDVNNSNSYLPNKEREINVQCSDLKDNDGNGLIDAADAGCHTDFNPNNPDSYDPSDTLERGPRCSNKKDDDSDGFTDAADSGCHSDRNPNNPDSYDPSIDTELVPRGDCSDNIDNDGNGDVDGADPQCHTDGNPNNPDSYRPERPETPEFSPGPIIETE